MQPGAKQTVIVDVEENDSSHPMSYWDTTSGSWQTAPGGYVVYVGNSSDPASLKVVGGFRVGS